MSSFFILFFSILFIFNTNVLADYTFYISKRCDIERKKFRQYYHEYIDLAKNEQYISAKRKFIDLEIAHSMVNLYCPYDITKYTNNLFFKIKSLNEGTFMHSQWTNKNKYPKKTNFTSQQNQNKSYEDEYEEQEIHYTEEEQKTMLKKKYKNTPTLYIEDIIIYNVQKISYFRKNKNKVMIVGAEKNYVFPLSIIKTATLKNATPSLKKEFHTFLKTK